MKKALIILAVFAGIISFTSCSKNCKCTSTLNGETVFSNTVELKDGEKCSDYDGSVTILGQSVSLKCTAKLF